LWGGQSCLRPAMADEWNKRTEFTFNESVEIPGNVLTPGKCVFEIAQSDSNRNTVLVYSAIPAQASEIR
jgi:hypothetical protein